MVNLRIGSVLRHLFYHKGTPEASSAGVVKGSRYDEYSFTLDSLSLNASGFCNMGVYNFLKKVISYISEILAAVSMAVTVLVIVMVVVDVCMRRFFNSPIMGSYELCGLAFSMMVFPPLSKCALANRHIELGIIVDKFPKAVRRVVEAIMMLLTVGVLALMSWQILVYGTRMKVSNAETVFLKIPIYPFMFLAAFGIFMLAIAYLIRLVGALINIPEESE